MAKMVPSLSEATLNRLAGERSLPAVQFRPFFATATTAATVLRRG